MHRTFLLSLDLQAKTNKGKKLKVGRPDINKVRIQGSISFTIIE